MITNLTKFNKTISQFIDNLIETYSDNTYYEKEIGIFKIKFELLRKTNPQKCLENFLIKIYPYKKQIMNEEETFFMNKDYSNDTNQDDNLIKALNENGISTGIHYPTPLPYLDAYKYLNHSKEDFPVAMSYKDEILSLPMYPELRTDQIAKISEIIIKKLNK